MTKSTEILVVDDNPGDAILLREAFLDRHSSARLTIARDGLEALHLLRQEEGSQTWRPDLVILDLKMPRMDGLTFLSEIKSDPSLDRIAVIVLTGSDAPEDREAARSLGAMNYFTKPNKLDEWVALSAKLEEYAASNE